MSGAATTRSLNSIRYFTVHHAAVKPGAKNLEELKRRAASYDRTARSKPWATATGKEKGYEWNAYHWMISRDGAVLQVQLTKYMRHHAGDNARRSESHNLWGNAILLDGDFRFETPTEAQMQAASQIIYEWERDHKISTTVRAHGETSIKGTSCAGQNVGKSTQAGSNLRHIIKLVNEKHGGTLPDENEMRIRALLGVRTWVIKRRARIVNPVKKNELALLIAHISARMAELGA